MQRLVLAIFSLLIVLGATGCSYQGFDFDFSDPPPPPPPAVERRNLESEDQDAIYPGVKASFAILPKDEVAKKGILDPGALAEWPQVFRSRSQIGATAENAKPRAPRRSRVRPTVSVDLDYAVGLGVDDAKGLTAFDYIDFDGVQTFGPTQVDYKYDLHLASVSIRSGVRFFDIVSLEGLGGVSISALDLQVQSTAARTTQTIVGYGGNAGVRLTLTPHQVIDLYVQYQLHILGSPQHDQQSISLSTFEAGSQLHLTSNFSVFGGWRSWRYIDRIKHASNVEIEDVGGPTFGLLFRH